MENINENSINDKQYVVFTLENEDYGIDIVKIKTIERMLPTTRVPNTPYYIDGVINLRGDIIPIIDLRKRFNLPETEETEDTRIIIFSINEVITGLIVDIVEEVMHLKEEYMDESTHSTNEARSGYIQSIGRFEDKIVTILNLEKLISITEEDLV